ncbi:cyclase family protein [Halovivax cerinus]|uniref:Cyclase family protein n=1 Tax=Halovivax cerinus TaxID=1487865 RepID=A0ABD5NNL1_9EURY|nr:cyclase family protein [Halovivax cerinus]
MVTYDLSQQIRDGMPVYPGDPTSTVRPLATVPDDGYRVTGLELDSHTGTHVDAPAHMLETGRSIDEYDPATFRFAALVADLAPLASRASITAEQLRRAVAPCSLDGVDLLVIRTGWDDHWGSDRYFDHPSLTADAAAQIVDWGCHVGVDAPSVDPTPTDRAGADDPDGYPAHQILFEADRLIVENLRGLDRLPTGESFVVHAYPLPIARGDGAPVRAVASV